MKQVKDELNRLINFGRINFAKGEHNTVNVTLFMWSLYVKVAMDACVFVSMEIDYWWNRLSMESTIDRSKLWAGVQILAFKKLKFRLMS